MDGGGDGARRGRPLDPYVDEALRIATLEVLANSGWRGATVERIAERAGVARTTIYRRHGSVHGVLMLLMDDMYPRTPAPDTGSLRSDLVASLRALLLAWRHPAFADFMCAMVAAQREDTALQEAYRARFAAQREINRRMLERAVERGELRPDADGELLLDLLFSVYPQRAVVADKLDDDAAHIVDTVLPSFAVFPRSAAG